MIEDATGVIELQQHGMVLTVALNRPESHNALTPEVITALTLVFDQLSGRDDVRVVILTGNGRSFCAGADLGFMRQASAQSFEENVRGGLAIFDLMLQIDACPKPVIGRINGATIGGGVGLVSCCDIALAVENARFGFSEVRLGLVPAAISPFVVAKIGAGRARELFMTGERFDARFAQQIGLINQVVADEAALDAAVKQRVEQLMLAAPGALAAAKELVRHVAQRPKVESRTYTAELLARRRASAEGHEGMSAFLEKRKPDWLPDAGSR